MAGAFSSAFSSAFDVGSSSPLPDAPQKSSLAGGLLFARRQLQYIALAGPLLIPAAPVVVPDLSQAFGDVPVRRRFLVRHTQTPEWGRADPPPPAAPDLAALIPQDPTRRIPQTWAQPLAQLLPAPAVPGVDWFPSRETPIVRRRFPVWEGFVKPPERPTIPFDPSQQVATLPHPALRPSAISALTAITAIPPPAGPPSSALTPPGVISWGPPPNQPVRPPAQPQPLAPGPQNLVPIPAVAPPELSWQGSADVPVRLTVRLPSEVRQPIDPIDTPALLSSFWTGLYPSGPFPKPGLLAALQQAGAEAPPIIEILVQAGSWRGEYPAYLVRLARLVPGEGILPPNPAIIAVGVPCIELIDPGATYSTLIATAATTPTLLLPEATSSHLADPEAC